MGKVRRLVKYIGDAVLCVFPGGREPDAVRCARRLRDGFRQLLGRYVPDSDSQLEVAISSGEAVAHASVLNRFPGIKVTGKVREALDSDFQATEMPAVPPKWSREPLGVWIVHEA